MRNRVNASMLCGLLAACFWLSGCRTREAISVAPAKTFDTAERFFAELLTQAPEYQTLTARLRFELTSTDDGKSLGSRADMKILHDKKIHISILPFAGIEAARIEISPDSVKLIDRLNKRYVSDSFANLKGDMNPALNFYNLQSILTNRIFLSGETMLPDNAFGRFSCEPTPQGYIFLTQDDDGLSYRFTGYDAKLQSTEIGASGNKLNLDYMNFGLVGGQVFPMKLMAEWSEADKVKGRLAVQYSQIDFDEPVNITFTVPKNYERVDLVQFLKSIGQI